MRTSYFARMVADEKKKIIYCRLAKVGTTTFLAILANNTLTQDKRTLHDMDALAEVGVRPLDQFPLPEIEHRLGDYWKFLAVRHPFDRLHSAWLDLFAHRFSCKKTSSDPTADRIRSLIESLARRWNMTLDRDSETRGINITWPLFVRLVATNAWHNLHWLPYTQQCHPCHIKYNYILKFETFEDDIPFVISKSAVRLANVPKNNQRQPEMRTSEKLSSLRTIYEDIPVGVMENLLSLYKNDFALFGYRWDVAGGYGSCAINLPGLSVTGAQESCC